MNDQLVIEVIAWHTDNGGFCNTHEQKCEIKWAKIKNKFVMYTNSFIPSDI